MKTVSWRRFVGNVYVIFCFNLGVFCWNIWADGNEASRAGIVDFRNQAVFTEISGETPTEIPTVEPTPNEDPIVTPTPDEPHSISGDYTIKELASGFKWYAVHPETGDVVFLNYVYDDKYQSYLDFSTLEPSTWKIDMSIYSTEVREQFRNFYEYSTRDMAVSSDNKIYVIGSDLFEFIPANVESPVRRWDIYAKAVHVVSEQDRIPNTKVGDVLILRRPSTDVDYKEYGYLGNIFAELNVFDPVTGTLASEPLITTRQFPRGMEITDMVIGPDHRLYFISNTFSKIFYLDMDGELKEYFHYMIPLSAGSLSYLSANRSFLIFSRDPETYYEKELWGLSMGDHSMNPIASLTSTGRVRVSPTKEDTFYLSHRRSVDGVNVLYSMTWNAPEGTPTPLPPVETPTATPTTIPGWYMVDGYGGIHSSNPEIQAPILPYFLNFDIVRDIEPDPLGRGWYMLDGYGGIHRSSDELPMPVGLPYFGFDIARNLEVVNKDGEYQFYLLDGYGVVHTTGEPFDFGLFPWFGKDIMRNLEPDPHGNGWIVMDQYGYLYWNEQPKMDSIRFGAYWAINPIMRSFVRFPDEKTMMVDGSGGRHTNPYYPLQDRQHAFSSDFYFPGWDIIRDIEVVPVQGE